ncbi:flagellar motor switch protein FliG [Paracoccus sp. p4-l81]|uniref:flagellar motor switch protein FliG n=1 Tax=unclassified Paracoccus (in: a-proteobacteria) TaxID=2688777 RepID=UPI0035B87208
MSSSLGGLPGPLTQRQKVAIIVRLLAAEGADLPLSDLPADMQEAITESIAGMEPIDRDTLDHVVHEFCTLIEGIGLAFPEGLGGALDLLEGHLSREAAGRLRRMAGASSGGDPWERVTGLSAEALLPVAQNESVEIAAVMVSKVAVSKAADILGRLPQERARAVAYAVSLTSNIAPETVRRIGLALAHQLDAAPVRAFDTGPVERVGAILNYSPANTRDAVLSGLEQDDADFAAEVKKAIFTFTNIPVRIDPRDIPKILREIDQTALLKALAGAKGKDAEAAEFILGCMSQRMAATLREEMGNLGKLKDKDIEEAMAGVVTTIRQMEAAGEIFLIAGED